MPLSKQHSVSPFFAFLALALLLLSATAASAQTDIDTLMRISPDAVDKLVKYKARDSGPWTSPHAALSSTATAK